LEVPLRLVFPQPPPHVGWGQKGRTRGDRARDASGWGGRASRLQPPPAPPGRSRAWWNACQVGRPRSERWCKTSCSWNRHEPRRAPGGQPKARCLHRPGRARADGRLCGAGRAGHSEGRELASGCASTIPVAVLGGP
jgi:hypothetical protein